MAEEIGWNRRSPEPPKEDKPEKLPEVPMYGLEPVVVEEMILGYLVEDPTTPENFDRKAADVIMGSSITEKHFESRAIGLMFNELLAYYRTSRARMSPETYAASKVGSQGKDQASAGEDFLVKCHSSAVIRRIDPVVLLQRLKDRYYEKVVHDIYKQWGSARNDPSLGPDKARLGLIEDVRGRLVDPDGSVIQMGDLAMDFELNIEEIRDRKEHPERYSGKQCGIKPIDDVTRGFSVGQLTVLVGKPAGYKTTMMLNIGIGCWRREMNVLYITLEMDRRLIEKRLMCMGARISWKRILNGTFTEPDDGENLRQLEQGLARPNLDPEERAKLERRQRSLRETISSVPTGDRTDKARLDEFRQEVSHNKSQFKVISLSETSGKIKISQLELWLKENRSVFQPDIVILDYLALVAPENDKNTGERRDIELGDACKQLRRMGQQMGFHPISAAQLTRKAIQRVKEVGTAVPEKAGLGLDDIAGSSMIGDDCDACFIMWPQDGGGGVHVFSAKDRHGSGLPQDGVRIAIDADSGIVAGDIGVDSASAISASQPLSAAYAATRNWANGNTVPLLDGEEIRPIFDSPQPDTGDTISPDKPPRAGTPDDDVGDL